MRTRTKSIVAVLALLSLASGAIGCRHTAGPWYSPSSYAWGFKPSEETIPPYEHDGLAGTNTLPHTVAPPMIQEPSGGYTTTPQRTVLTQYELQQNTQVARADSPATTTPTGPYHDTVPMDYQRTNAHTPYSGYSDPSMSPAYYAPAPGTVDPMQNPNMFPANPQTQPPYSGMSNPGYQDPAAFGAPPAAMPNMGYPAQPATPNMAYPAQQPATPNTGFAAPAAAPDAAYGNFGAPVAAPAGAPVGAPMTTTTVPYGAPNGTPMTAAPAAGQSFGQPYQGSYGY